jgi:CarD family transcriptional regulator
MRSISSKAEIDEAIAQIPSYEVSWVEDDRARAEQFRNQLHTCCLTEWTKLIKTLLAQKEKKTEQGKKLRQSDETVLKNAQRLIHEEFATSLHIPVEQVSEYIRSKI